MLKRISRKAFIDKFWDGNIKYDPLSVSRWLFVTPKIVCASFGYMSDHYTCFSFIFKGKEYLFKKDKKGIWRIYERNY